MNSKNSLAVLGFLFALVIHLAAADAPDPSRSRLGMNLSGIQDWTTEHPFVDVFRTSRQWISQRKGSEWGKGPELERDANGWIKRLAPDCWAETLVLTGGHAPDGEYVCLYEGDGDLEIKGARREVSREPGRIVVDIDGRKGGIFISLKRVNPSKYVRNIRLFMPGFEKATSLFHPAFLARWSSFNTIRFMDWMETNGSRQREWTDRATSSYCHFTERGVPVEVMVDLCNRLKANAWFCMPHRATDDYVRQFAEAVKAQLDPSLKVYIEYSNEIWNSGFEQTRYAGDEGLKMGLAEKHWEAGWRYSALRSVEIFNIWEKAWGGHDRFVRVIASQAANAYVSEQKLKTRDAWQHCDALAIAPYMSFNVPLESSKDSPGAAEVAQWPLNRLLDHVETNSLPECIRWMRDSARVANQYKLKLIAYEAGQHLVGVLGAENNDALTKLLQQANRNPRMGAFYTQYLDAWKATGGDLCCIFSSVGSSSKWGSWCLLEAADQPVQDAPKYQAVIEWNRKNSP